MHAERGDKLVVKRHGVRDQLQVGIIREVHGVDGSPPYVVEWSDLPGQHIIWPGPDASVERFTGATVQRAKRAQPSK